MKWRKNRVCDLPLGRPREDRSSPSARPLALPRSHNLPPPRVRLPYPKSLLPIPRARPLALPPVPQSPTTARPPPLPKITPSNPTHVESASLPTLPPLVPPPIVSSRDGNGEYPVGDRPPVSVPVGARGGHFSPSPSPCGDKSPRGSPLPSALIYSIQDC
jgi:hypothetical protein